ncbi:MAG: exodeoxyribonuclease VII large subunit [Chloroflexi bacterium]|nr:exodeoxyribonuclease VII large subunit [Chloroflexota bacterium]
MSQLPLFNPPSWTVTDLTRRLRSLLNKDPALQDLWVLGEVSNFSRPSSGHLYFTLKDATASLRCVMWRSAAARLPYLPREGDAVEVHGQIDIYETGGQYQLYADQIRPAGEGALFQEFLRLKARLEAEGLFDAERKLPLPALPRVIGIVTSPTGAALQDMLNTLRRRYPLASVVLAPTPVQGAEAPPGIVNALERINRLTQPDVILLARGGGSIEDLWAFNDERVARSIAASPAPVVCGVGHETDFTIADFVADLRAPTPTAAAELATPDRLDLLADLTAVRQRLERAMSALAEARRWQLEAARNRLRLHSPANRLRSQRQLLDELTRRSQAGLAHSLELRHARLLGMGQRLASLNPMEVLRRGYAVVAHPDGRILHRAAEAAPGSALTVRLHDGALAVRVEEAGSAHD